MNEIQVSQPHSLSVYSAAAIQIIKDQICKGATDLELKQFIEVCKRTGLDPFTKQIYAIKRWDSQVGREVFAHQISIDGLRVIAERSGKYQGQEGPLWCGEDGVWVDCWLKDTPPAAAKVGIVRSDFKQVLWATARFKVYAQKKKDGTLTKFWKDMPDLMISKVAEGLALRKAFPNDQAEFYFSEAGQKTQELVAKSVQQIQKAFEPHTAAVDAALSTAPDETIDISTGEVVPPLATKSEPVPESAPEVLTPFDAYTIPFGKHTGKTLKQLGLNEAKNYRDWLKSSNKGTGKALMTYAQELIKMVDDWDLYLSQQALAVKHFPR